MTPVHIVGGNARLPQKNRKQHATNCFMTRCVFNTRIPNHTYAHLSSCFSSMIEHAMM